MIIFLDKIFWSTSKQHGFMLANVVTGFLLSLSILAFCSNCYGQNLMKKTDAVNWSIPYTQNIILDTANPSYGVFNEQNFQEILTQKKQGNPNAEYAFAQLYLVYQIDRFNSTNLPNAKEESIEIMWRLGNQDHPLACEYLARGGRKIVFQRISDPKKAQDKVFHCFEVAFQSGLNIYFEYAYELIFRSYRYGVDDVFIADTPAINHPDVLKKAAILYEKCALLYNNTFCAARVEEMYYHGYGVQRDLIKAYAWARFVAERKNFTDKIYQASRENYLSLQQSLSPLEKEAGDKLYEQIQKRN